MRQILGIIVLWGLVEPAWANTDHARFFADREVAAESCGRRLAYADGAYEDEAPAALENLAAMREARAELERAVRLWWPAGPGPFLEIGALTAPILRPDAPATTVYWDMDVAGLAEVERWAGKDGRDRVHPIYIDFNHVTPEYRAAFLARNEQILRNAHPDDPGFRAVVISQVFNYVDYRALLKLVASMQRTKGYVFITNRVDHGDDDHFHVARPRRAEEIDRALETLGYSIVRRLPSRKTAASDEQVTWVARLR